jgi:hypothetical protein
VRRALAIALLIVINLLLIAPAFAATGEAQLPLCCRANGKHKCSMQGASGPSFSKIGEKCPFAPAGGLGVSSHVILFHPVRARFASILSQPNAPAQAETLARISLSRTRQERGPPALLLL